MPKFTPGKWVVHPGMDPICVFAPSPAPEHTTPLIAKVGRQSGSCLDRSTEREETLANAQLIAAAPEMYEALKDVLDELIHANRLISDEHDGRYDESKDETCIQARKALAKAEGRA